MSVCIDGGVRGGVGPGGKGPEDDEPAAILKIKENKPAMKMKPPIHAIPYIRFPMPLIWGSGH